MNKSENFINFVIGWIVFSIIFGITINSFNNTTNIWVLLINVVSSLVITIWAISNTFKLFKN